MIHLEDLFGPPGALAATHAARDLAQWDWHDLERRATTDRARRVCAAVVELIDAVRDAEDR